MNYFMKQKYIPDFLPTCFCGMIIWQDRASFVFGMGWFKRQMQRTTCKKFKKHTHTHTQSHVSLVIILNIEEN